MGRSYRIQEFAEIAGVTVKALHHYDRLGLLRPRRTDAGYRLYTERDLERLEQIVALRFLGLPLKRIKAVLDRANVELVEALRLQRGALEEKQRLLARAIGVIVEIEKTIASGKPAEPQLLKRLIEAIDMQDGIDVMKRYYSEEAWLKQRRRYEEGPSQEWKDLYREVEAALEEDPAGERAQALAARWMELTARGSGGDPEVQAGAIKAWADRNNWPAALQQRVSEYKLDKLAPFIGKAIAAHRKKYYTEEGWAQLEKRSIEERDRISAEWHALFLEVGAAMDEDPASEKAKALAARWSELAGKSVNGNSELRDGAVKAWLDREQWPGWMQRQIGSFDIEKAVTFIAQASAHRGT